MDGQEEPRKEMAPVRITVKQNITTAGLRLMTFPADVCRGLSVEDKARAAPNAKTGFLGLFLAVPGFERKALAMHK
ncbi:MAG: hypothetical protein M3R45_04645 [Pseudomonadota bacterium]|nr:hypothetical protein [Pseudomonadota bacterium]